MRFPRLAALVVAACLLLSACEADYNPTNPTPAPFTGIAQALVAQGLVVSNVTSGDAGCGDQSLAKLSVSFTATGLDQTTPTRIYLYMFRDHATYERLRQSVDACARAYVTDPAAFGSVDASPFVAAGAGPWGTEFTNRLRAGLTKAAGNGG